MKLDTFRTELEAALTTADSWGKEQALRQLSIRIGRAAWGSGQAEAQQIRERALSEANRVAESLMRDAGHGN